MWWRAKTRVRQRALAKRIGNHVGRFGPRLAPCTRRRNRGQSVVSRAPRFEVAERNALHPDVSCALLQAPGCQRVTSKLACRKTC